MASPCEALVVVDLQRGFDDPCWGARNNPEAETNGLRILQHWRGTGRPVVIVRHDSTDAHSPLRPELPGNRLKPGFEPCPEDIFIIKRGISAFIGTDLEARLRAAGITHLTVFGLTTDQCVSTLVRMAANLGFHVTLVEDACACFKQTAFTGGPLSAEVVHLVHVTTLLTEFCRVTSTDELLGGRRDAHSIGAAMPHLRALRRPDAPVSGTDGPCLGCTV